MVSLGYVRALAHCMLAAYLWSWRPMTAIDYSSQPVTPIGTLGTDTVGGYLPLV